MQNLGQDSKVEFFVDGIKIGENLTFPYEYTYNMPPSGDYDILLIATDDKGSITTSQIISITVEPALVLDLKIMLGGNYNATNGLMNDELRVANLISLSFGGYNIADVSILNTTGNDAIIDWVTLELRDINAPNVISISRPALLRRDGDIVDVDGQSLTTFDILPLGSYYVAVRHRNQLGAMYDVPILIVD